MRSLRATSERGIVIAWKWASPSSTVQLAGNFSGWTPWRMFWHSPTADHRIFLPLKLLGNDGSVRYKFIVDGAWLCDGSKEMEDDGAGNVNNMYRLSPRQTNLMPSTLNVLQLCALPHPSFSASQKPAWSVDYKCSEHGNNKNHKNHVLGDAVFSTSSMRRTPPKKNNRICTV